MLKSQIESLLFISVKPISIRRFVRLFNVEQSEIEKIIQTLQDEYSRENRGMQIVEVEQAETKKYQMVTNSEYSDLVKKFTKQEIGSELTKPSLETLTIIAYKGPITKPELEKIRGVNCSMILRNLLIRNLVEEQKDSEKGLPSFNVTSDFLQWLGLTSVKDLPDYDTMRNDQHLDDLLESNTE